MKDEGFRINSAKNLLFGDRPESRFLVSLGMTVGGVACAVRTTPKPEIVCTAHATGRRFHLRKGV